MGKGKNGTFLDGRLSPGKCSKCMQDKIVTVKFTDEKICKQCLDVISAEIGNRIASELGVFEPETAPPIPENIATELQHLLPKQFEPGATVEQERESNKPVLLPQGLSQDEIGQMSEGAEQSGGLGPASTPQRAIGVEGGWQ